MNKKRDGIIFGCFTAFFVISVVEKLIAIVLSITDPEIGLQRMFFGAKYNLFTYGASALCVLAFLVLFAFVLGNVLAVGAGRNHKILLLAVGIVLFGGMINIPHSMPVLQYASYVFLAAAILFRYFDIRQERCVNFLYAITAFIYLSVFILTIPVVAKTQAGNTNMGLYYMMGFGRLGAVALFVILLLNLFGDRYKFVTNIFFLIGEIAINAVVVLLAFNTPDFNLVLIPAIACGVLLAAFIFNRIVGARLKKKANS